MNTTIRPSGLAHKAFALLALSALVIGLVPMQAFADHDPFGGAAQTNVTVCHANNGNNGGFTANTVAVSSSGAPQGGHDANNGVHATDIIPPYHYLDGNQVLQSYPGKNWNTAGQVIWRNNCAAPTPVDVCPNITGAQATVPTGYEIVNGQCVLIVIDQCPNIDGAQATIPQGMIKNDAGQCVIPVVDQCPLVDGVQTDTTLCPPVVDMCPLVDGVQVNTILCPPVVDQCPLVDGVQADTTLCPVDVCPNDAGVQTNVNQCTVPPTLCTDTAANNNGQTLPCTYTDVCPNDAGVQTNVNQCTPAPTPVCAVGSNLLSNASFETPALTGNGTWGILTSVLDWAISGSNGLELWRNFNGTGAGLASDGAQNAELDGNAPTTITQTVVTVPGATYQLKYDFSARAGRNLADNAVEAYADTMLVSSTSADGTANSGNVWTTKSATFVAADASTDIKFVDKGAATSYGSLLDNTVLCYVSAPVPGCMDSTANNYNASATIDNGSCTYGPTTCEVTIVSDTTNYVVEKAANAQALTYIHPAWATAAIAGATWIWGDNPVTAPVVPETQTFRKQFGFVGTVTSAKLYVAADNSYSSLINNSTSGSSTAENNFQLATQDEYTVTSLIAQGNNELKIAVNNFSGSSNPQDNPAGLLYKLVISGTPTTDSDCSVPYVPPAPTCFDGILNQNETTVDVGGVCSNGDGDGGDNDPDTYRLEGYVWHDDNENLNWDENFVPEQETFVKTEAPLAGWTVNITNGTRTLSTTTDATGFYYFEVPAGTWTITEVVQDGWDRTTQESYVVTVPQVLTQNFIESVISFIIPTAYAAVLATYDGYDFGNNEEPSNNGGGNGNGNGGNRGGTLIRDREGDVLGISDSPAPLVLGEQVSAVPTGAPNTGKGGSAIVVLGQFLALPRRREV